MMKPASDPAAASRPTAVQHPASLPDSTPGSGFAVAAGYLGVLGIVGGFTAIPGLLCGLVALSQFLCWRRAPRWGVAVYGILFSLFWILLWVPIYVTAKERNPNTPSCVSNLKQVSTAFIAYTQDYDNWTPPVGEWSDKLYPYLKTAAVFQCPVGDPPNNYAMNNHLDRLPLSRVAQPDACALVFDSRVGWNGFGGRGLVEPRHHGAFNLAFLDGRVKEFRLAQMDEIQWAPQLLTPPPSAAAQPVARPSSRARSQHRRSRRPHPQTLPHWPATALPSAR